MKENNNNNNESFRQSKNILKDLKSGINVPMATLRKVYSDDQMKMFYLIKNEEDYWKIKIKSLHRFLQIYIDKLKVADRVNVLFVNAKNRRLIDKDDYFELYDIKRLYAKASDILSELLRENSELSLILDRDYIFSDSAEEAPRSIFSKSIYCKDSSYVTTAKQAGIQTKIRFVNDVINASENPIITDSEAIQICKESMSQIEKQNKRRFSKIRLGRRLIKPLV